MPESLDCFWLRFSLLKSWNSPSRVLFPRTSWNPPQIFSGLTGPRTIFRISRCRKRRTWFDWRRPHLSAGLYLFSGWNSWPQSHTRQKWAPFNVWSSKCKIHLGCRIVGPGISTELFCQSCGTRTVTRQCPLRENKALCLLRSLCIASDIIYKSSKSTLYLDCS